MNLAAKWYPKWMPLSLFATTQPVKPARYVGPSNHLSLAVSDPAKFSGTPEEARTHFHEVFAMIKARLDAFLKEQSV